MRFGEIPARVAVARLVVRPERTASISVSESSWDWVRHSSGRPRVCMKMTPQRD